MPFTVCCANLLVSCGTLLAVVEGTALTGSVSMILADLKGKREREMKTTREEGLVRTATYIPNTVTKLMCTSNCLKLDTLPLPI